MIDTKDFHFLTQKNSQEKQKISILATLGFQRTEVLPSAGSPAASDKAQLSLGNFTTVFLSLPPLHWRAWWEQPARKVRGKPSSRGKLSAAMTLGGCSCEQK